MADKPSLMQEFREFAVKGNVMDLAVGVIIGAAFGKIVTSFVEDIVMPPLGLVTGRGKNLADLYLNLSGRSYASFADAKKAGAAVIGYGSFLSNVFNFLIIALAVFLMVKAVNRLRRQEAVAPSAPPAPTKEETLLTEIRDALVARPPA
jgi:large conductance mechanosensitive channel